MASRARWKSSRPRWDRRGAITNSGGSPAMRLRVMRICMMLTLVITTSSSEGGRGGGSVSRPASSRWWPGIHPITPRCSLRTQAVPATALAWPARSSGATPCSTAGGASSSGGAAALAAEGTHRRLWRRMMSALRSTAITMSAPMARAREAGAGVAEAPPTPQRPPRRPGGEKAGRAGGGPAGIEIDRDHDVRAHGARQRGGHGVDDAAIDQQPPLALHGREQAGQRDGGTHGIGDGALAQPDLGARMQVGGHGAEGNLQVLDGRVHEVLAPERDQLLALEHAARDVEVHETEHLAHAQSQHPFLEADRKSTRLNSSHLVISYAV